MIVDWFGGPGGWDEGLRSLGRTDVVGIEWDAAACATRAAAGHRTIRADATTYPVAHLAGKVEGLIASPPCPDWSSAGRGARRDGTSGWMVDLVPQWVQQLRPEWVACEQVPPALEVWHEHAHRYRQLGYSVWTGVLNAADYGVPQTRRRAILIASRVRPALPPMPTHSRTPQATLLGSLRPWVSMAEALGWPVGRTLDRRQNGAPVLMVDDVPSPTLTAAAVGKGVWKLTDRQANGSERTIDEPAPTITASLDNGNKRWCWERPATAVCGDPRLSPPGYRGRPGDYEDRTPPDYQPPDPEAHEVCPECGDAWDFHDAGGFCAGPCGGGKCHGRQFITYTGSRSMDNAVRLTIREALILQGFPPDYPVQGTKTKQFEQVGNAVPPPLAVAVLSALTGARAEAAA